MFNHPLSLHRCMEDFSSLSIFQKYPKELKFQGHHKLKVRNPTFEIPQKRCSILAVTHFGGRGL